MRNLFVSSRLGELVPLSEYFLVVEPVQYGVDTSPVPVIGNSASEVDVTSGVVQHLK